MVSHYVIIPLYIGKGSSSFYIPVTVSLWKSIEEILGKHICLTFTL